MTKMSVASVRVARSRYSGAERCGASWPNSFCTEGGSTISWNASGASGVATARIRTYSIVLSVLGGFVAFIIAATSAVMALLGGGVAGGGIGGAQPWDDANPAVADHVAGSTVWSGVDAALITLTEADFANGPLLASNNRGTALELYLTRPEDIGATDRGYPDYIDVQRDDEQNVIVPTGAITELWVVSAGAWALNLVPLDAETITGSLSGQGNGYVIYEGNATSAQFAHRGDGIFFVSVFAANEVDRPIIDSGNVDARVSWTPSEYVVFFIESDADRGAWTIDIDLLARDATPTPLDPSTPSSPTPSPTP